MSINKEINYKRVVRSVAMSKDPHQCGLFISKGLSKDSIKLEAINPRMNAVTSYLSMEIPIEEIDNVINALNEIKIDLLK